MFIPASMISDGQLKTSFSFFAINCQNVVAPQNRQNELRQHGSS